MKHIAPAETGEDEGEGLLVRRIRNGTVIDHIDGGEALNVVKILGIVGTTSEALSIATNVPSRHMEKKDIVKISNRELSKEEVDRIALISPRATINIIRNFKVCEKKGVEIPTLIVGSVRCPNPGSHHPDKRAHQEQVCGSSRRKRPALPLLRFGDHKRPDQLYHITGLPGTPRPGGILSLSRVIRFFRMDHVAVDIDLPTPDTGGRDPAAVLGQHTGDLVDIHLAQFLAPEPVDLNCHREASPRRRQSRQNRHRAPNQTGPRAARSPSASHICSCAAFAVMTAGDERSRSAFRSANGWIGCVFLLANGSVVSPITTCPSGPGSAKDRVRSRLWPS